MCTLFPTCRPSVSMCCTPMQLSISAEVVFRQQSVAKVPFCACLSFFSIYIYIFLHCKGTSSVHFFLCHHCLLMRPLQIATRCQCSLRSQVQAAAESIAKTTYHLLFLFIVQLVSAVRTAVIHHCSPNFPLNGIHIRYIYTSSLCCDGMS